MKYLLSSIIAVFSIFSLSAQNPFISVKGLSEGSQGWTLNEARSILEVSLQVEQQRIIAGPYARYAQKYLGVRAPLTDKNSWSFQSASVSLISEQEALQKEELKQNQVENVLHADALDEFPKMQIDKMSTEVRTLEEAAASAAATIYSLRRHRLELITGEAGENVFGQGLKAALDEISRLEQAYLELFLGKQIRQTLTKRLVVYPVASKKQYVICRFNPEMGLLSENNLSGDMILLQIEPSANVSSALQAGAKETNTIECSVANPSLCSVIFGGKEYGRQMLPLYEFGKTIQVALPRRK